MAAGSFEKLKKFFWNVVRTGISNQVAKSVFDPHQIVKETNFEFALKSVG